MDNTTPVGTWYLLANKVRLEMQLSVSGGTFTGWLANENGQQEPLTNFSWDPVSRWLEFRLTGPDFFQWYRLSVTYGVIAGRFSHLPDGARPENSAFAFHVTGWSPSWLDDDIVPRTWHLTLNQTDRAVLRIDRDQHGVLCGRFKIYAPREALEYGLTDIVWDGTHLSFSRIGPDITESFTGTVNGRAIDGSFSLNNALSLPWTGTRGEVLGFGLGSRLAQRAAWQAVTRARIINLTEGMNLAQADNPTVTVTKLDPSPLFPHRPFPDERDDNPGDEPGSYTLQRLRFSFDPGSRFDPANPPAPRVYEGFLARPIAPAPPEGYRTVIAVNGHGGSAEITMTGSLYWYGDSLARHGFVVLAIDIGHRPVWAYGPVFHPAIIDSNYVDSNWEETAERVFSVQRAIDWLLTQPDIRPDALFMTGLSMGGEVTTMTSALDERIRLVISAGYSPDMYVTDHHGNHPCYQWQHTDIHEYLDVSDYAALIAPRPLVVETGLADDTYSAMSPPWAADKQVLNRAYAAYGSHSSRLIHYLHYDGHNWHTGDVNPTHPERPRGVLASAITGPAAPEDVEWQTNGTTTRRSATLYTLIDEFLP